jgi:cobalt-zinc-cadmium resistance protein CzcA
MVGLMAIGILFAGYWSFNRLPIDAFPDISSPQVQIIVKAPGMSPTEVEQRITVPIELEVQGIPKQKIMRSTSKYALSIVTLDFEDSADIYWARQQVSERLSQIWDSLPAEIDGGLAPITTPLGEIYMYHIIGDGFTNRELREIQDWVIRPQLRTVDGIADINSLGGEVLTYEVVINPDKLVRFGLEIEDVEEALIKNNRNAGGDRINKKDEVFLIRTVGKITKIDDIENISVSLLTGNSVKIKDIAIVKESSMTRYGAVTADAKGEIVTGLALLTKGANSRTTVENLKKKIESLKDILPDGITLKPFYDRTELVETAVWTVESALIQAVVLIFIVLIILLGNFRSALVVSLNLPLSVLLTFILMNIFEVSANLMSLGGIAIAIGILIDSTIVVVENIYTKLNEPIIGVSKLHIIYRAVNEVAVPIVSGVMIIIVVFLPLFSLTGLEAKMFVPLAITISFAMAGSLFLALTVVPVLSSVLMKKSSNNQSKLFNSLLSSYKPILLWVLDKRVFASSVAFIMLIISGFVFTQIGNEFMPVMDEGSTVVIIEKDPKITLEGSIALDVPFQKAMMEIPEVIGVYSRTGADELRMDPMDLYQTDNFLITKPRSEWKITPAELNNLVREKLKGFEKIDVAFTQPIDMRVSEMLTGVRAAMAIKLFGSDIEILEKKSNEIEAVLTKITGAVDVIKTEITGQNYLQINIKHEEVAKYGLNVEDINRMVEVAIAGKVVSEVVRDNRKIPITIRFDEKDRSTFKEISRMLIPTDNGSKIPLSELAVIEEINGPFQITRETGQRQIVIQANVEGRDIVSFVEETKKTVAENVKLPKGYYLTYGGQFENQQRASKRLALVVPISILLIYLLLFTTFRSAKQAALVICNIPFALIGGIVALYFSGMYLSVPASVGFIVLFGVAVMNGVVMVDFFNKLRLAGVEIREAVYEGSLRRLRPVILTASITIIGLLPLLFASGPGSELQKPLAIVVIGGTITSTFLTLILLPVLYEWLEQINITSSKDSK